MDATWLDDFLALAECGSFGRAAERRRLTQPAFSRRVQSLERWVGAELVDRSSHQIGLTAAGLAFRPAAEDVRRRLLDGREQAQEAGRAAAGSIRLACTHMLASTSSAHIHPPTGGQGLNTSVQDAYNLGWKLGAVLAGAPDALLDSYEEERRPIAAGMLGLTTALLERAKQGEMRRGREARPSDRPCRGVPGRG